LVGDAITFAQRVGAKHTLLTHMCHDVGLHDEVNRKLPQGVELAYDSQVLIV
jgi:phosphoribosyl 1,2-cyclic phosphate phosphodiesterase